ncbi:hypothetical protein WR25_22290 [Diploscapter pachys]|uniref:G-protein coupled receptors family 1 profile domain-containing protein n=1 Tax=Diploscapter pachys TaxID=2018661 RepID=A0A2A2JTU9_9BILA|nr:hypothetical protein WR25_22290 [Diploscapter pachys]
MDNADSHGLAPNMNSSLFAAIITSLKDMQLDTANGTTITGLHVFMQDRFDGLKPYCHRREVAEVANLTAFLFHYYGPDDQGSEEHVHISIIAKIIFTIIFVLVACVGIVGNLLTALVIYKTSLLHSHTNYFLANLALSDLCLIVVGVPFDLIHLWMNSQPPPIPGYCSFMSTAISLFTFASILTIVSLTVERYVAIVYPFSHRSIVDRKRVMILIYSIWLIAFFPSLYIGMQFKRVVPDFCGYNRELGIARGSCDYVTSQDLPLRYPFELTMLVTFILPLFFIIFCYSRILITLSEISVSTTVHTPVGTTNSDSSQFQYHVSSATGTYTVHMKSSNSAPPSQQAQKMVIRMLVIVTSVFFICYLPYHIERMIVQHTKRQCDNSTLCLLLYPITGLLQYVSAMLNPIFYNLLSTRFRMAFNNLIKDFISKSDKEYSTLARL